MDVTADRDLLQFVDGDFYKRVEWLENLRSLLDDHSCVLLVQDFSFSLMFHKGDYPFGSDIVDGLQAGPRVRVFHIDRLWVNHDHRLLVHDSLSEELGLVSLECDLILFSRITILWLQFADLLERQDGLFHLSQGDISLTLSIETFDVCWVKFRGLTRIKQCKLVLLHLEAGEGAIAVQDCFLLWGYLAEDSLGVLLCG